MKGEGQSRRLLRTTSGRPLNLSQRPNVPRLDAVARRRLADGVSGITWGEMAVVFLNLTCIGVPERARHHHKRGTVHHGVAGESVPGGVEIDRRNASALRGFPH